MLYGRAGAPCFGVLFLGDGNTLPCSIESDFLLANTYLRQVPIVEGRANWIVTTPPSGDSDPISRRASLCFPSSTYL